MTTTLKFKALHCKIPYCLSLTILFYVIFVLLSCMFKRSFCSTVVFVCTLTSEERFKIDWKCHLKPCRDQDIVARIIAVLPDISLPMRTCYSHKRLLLICSWHSVTLFFLLPLLSVCCCGSVQYIHGRQQLTWGLLVCPFVHQATVPLPTVPLCRPGRRCLP